MRTQLKTLTKVVNYAPGKLDTGGHNYPLNPPRGTNKEQRKELKGKRRMKMTDTEPNFTPGLT